MAACISRHCFAIIIGNGGVAGNRAAAHTRTLSPRAMEGLMHRSLLLTAAIAVLLPLLVTADDRRVNRRILAAQREAQARARDLRDRVAALSPALPAPPITTPSRLAPPANDRKAVANASTRDNDFRFISDSS